MHDYSKNFSDHVIQILHVSEDLRSSDMGARMLPVHCGSLWSLMMGSDSQN